MDELDRNLLEAWGRVVERLRSDAVEARKRWRRSRGKVLRRPMRDWCLSLRASDTRISEWNTLISDPLAVGYRSMHSLAFDGRTVRELCAPVRIDWPGVRFRDAADMLGRHTESLRHWLPKQLRQGRTRHDQKHNSIRRYEEYSEPGGVFSVRYDKARCHGHNGMDVPVVWADRALNPGAARGARPHALWGSMWQDMQGCVTDDFEFSVYRLPRFRPYRDKRTGQETVRGRGWDFVCPGLIDHATGEQRDCGRRAQTLYMPLPVFTIARCLGDERGIEVGEVGKDKSAKPQAACMETGAGFKGRLSGRWFPGTEDRLQSRRTFACSHCWGVRHFSICDYQGWNDFVSHISGGLLFGKEVVRPAWLRYEWKRPRTQGKGRRVRKVGRAPMVAKAAIR